MTFSDFSITVSKIHFNLQYKKVQSLFTFFMNSNAKPDDDQIVFLIEPAVKNSIVW